MDSEKVFFNEEFKKCADFHGHMCPGLAIGYRAAKAGLERLGEKRAEDEEIVTIVENNACGTDAVQVLTGCTFGKGNFIHKDYGKAVYTFFERKTGKGVRVALKPGSLKQNKRHRELMGKIREGQATKEEEQEFQALHLKQTRKVLDKPIQDLFEVQDADSGLPPLARVEPSVPCGMCGEPTMASKMIDQAGKKICQGCQR